MKNFLRRFTTTIQKQQSPPMLLHGTEGRYATALFQAAQKQKQLETVENELKRVSAAVKKDAKLEHFLQDPLLSRDQKTQGVQSLLQGKYTDLVRNFFVVLAENARLNETHKIVDAYHQLMGAYRGEVVVQVTSAKPLDAKLNAQLKSVLAKGGIVAKADNLKIVSKVNPALLGGLVVEIGEKTIDLSISSRLTKLNKLVTEAV